MANRRPHHRAECRDYVLGRARAQGPRATGLGRPLQFVAQSLDALNGYVIEPQVAYRRVEMLLKMRPPIRERAGAPIALAREPESASRFERGNLLRRNVLAGTHPAGDIRERDRRCLFGGIDAARSLAVLIAEIDPVTAAVFLDCHD